MWVKVGSFDTPLYNPASRQWDKTAKQIINAYQCNRCKAVSVGTGDYPTVCCEPCRVCGKPSAGHPPGPQVIQHPMSGYAQFGYQTVYANQTAVTGGDHWHQPERREKERG